MTTPKSYDQIVESQKSIPTFSLKKLRNIGNSEWCKDGRDDDKDYVEVKVEDMRDQALLGYFRELGDTENPFFNDDDIWDAALCIAELEKRGHDMTAAKAKVEAETNARAEAEAEAKAKAEWRECLNSWLERREKEGPSKQLIVDVTPREYDEIVARAKSVGLSIAERAGFIIQEKAAP